MVLVEIKLIKITETQEFIRNEKKMQRNGRVPGKTA